MKDGWVVLSLYYVCMFVVGYDAVVDKVRMVAFMKTLFSFLFSETIFNKQNTKKQNDSLKLISIREREW
jgi:hypothetical protein